MDAAACAERPHRVLILYATQTGNAEDVADRIRREAARRHYKPLLMSFGEYDMEQLSLEETVIFVVSTKGQGDVPDSMKESWKYLRGPAKGLDHVHFAVFGLGDSGYEQYNVVAKRLHNGLCRLGGKPMLYRGLGDDQHPSGYDGALTPWLHSLWRVMRERISLPSGMIDPGGELSLILDPPKYKIRYHQSYQQGCCSRKLSDVQTRWADHERARKMMELANGRSTHASPRNNVVFAQMTQNIKLTAPEHEQDIRHLEFDLGESGLTYIPGDVLGVYPNQPEKAVQSFMRRCNLLPELYISVEAVNADQKVFESSPVRIRTLIEAVMDVSSSSPRRYFFEVMSHFAKAEHEKERLQYFASAEGQQDLYRYNQRERRTVVEVLEDFPSVELSLEWLVQLVPRLVPRYYSISSSLRAHPNEVHATVAVVKWTTPYKRKRHGLCSAWLASLEPKKDVVPLWITGGAMKLPGPSVPLVLVGPGTGCAPFRSFLEERAMLSSVDEAVAPVLFFFGCRDQGSFLYSDFWKTLTRDGRVLSEEVGGGFFVAFSRCQQQKVYVQHEIREQASKVRRLLQDGGLIFVCGSAANNMPTDIVSALKDCVEKDALTMLKKRIIIETWS